MKKISLLLCLLCLNLIHTKAQIDDVQRFVNNEIIAREKEFIGNPLSKLYDKLNTEVFKINHMSTLDISGWDTPEGLDRMIGVTIYNNSKRDVTLGKETFVLDIYLGIYLDERKFWNELPDEGWMEALKSRTKDMIVRKIEVRKMKLTGWEEFGRLVE